MSGGRSARRAAALLDFARQHDPRLLAGEHHIRLDWANLASTRVREQHLERARATAQQHHRRGRARHRLGSEVQLLAGAWSIRCHRLTLPRTLRYPSVKWMCESCGFIYDPADGDPDGGIPAGTAFEDIPETWFCPVCGARKQDFTPYEE